jgi:G protein-coupled receptor Mth (Methuselah protein)
MNFKKIIIILTTIGWVESKVCNLLDTIPITGDFFTMSNDDLLHNGITYTKDQWDYFNKDLVNGTEVVVPKHIRGCFCKVKECIRLCCPVGYVGIKEKGCVKFNGTYRLPMDVYDDSGQFESVNLATDATFNHRFIASRPCKEMFYLDPSSYDEDQFMFQQVSISNPMPNCQNFMEWKKLFKIAKFC